jgi:hypothetical protein
MRGAGVGGRRAGQGTVGGGCAADEGGDEHEQADQQGEPAPAWPVAGGVGQRGGGGQRPPPPDGRTTPRPPNRTRSPTVDRNRNSAAVSSCQASRNGR